MRLTEAVEMVNAYDKKYDGVVELDGRAIWVSVYKVGKTHPKGEPVIRIDIRESDWRESI
mgnify:CR=1 FL=1